MTNFKQALLALAVISPLLCSAKLVIFGDSLSDNGVDGILAGNELVNNNFSTGPVSSFGIQCFTLAFFISDTLNQSELKVETTGADCHFCAPVPFSGLFDSFSTDKPLVKDFATGFHKSACLPLLPCDEHAVGWQVNVGVYPPAPYYFGRFTNGFIWVDVAARLLGQEVDNYAAGGSNGNAGEITVDPPFAYVSGPTRVTSRSLVQQVRLDRLSALLKGKFLPKAARLIRLKANTPRSDPFINII